LADLRSIITTEGGAPEWQDYAAWRDAQSGDDPNVEISPKDIAIQLYTSGTTGKPKGAMLSHSNFLNLVETGKGEKPDWNQWTEVFGCGFVQMYGMTETTGTIVALPPEDHVEGLERMRSAGKALPGIELAILDADGKKLPPGEVGEIATRSGSNMVGYWNLPEATAKTLDSEGWLRTGDAGYMDRDGYLYI